MISHERLNSVLTAMTKKYKIKKMADSQNSWHNNNMNVFSNKTSEMNNNKS